MVYLIHLETPLAHSRHYLGFAESDVHSRLETHRKGQGSRMLRAANLAKINYDIVRIWHDGDRNFERSLKKRKNAKFLCPVCTPKTTTN